MNKARLKKELQMLTKEPPHGVACWPKDDQLNQWEATLVGGADTPYKGGVFKLEIQIPERYPFEPPHVLFQTKIYHPNIDDKGRICLDVLKMPPQGSWKPAQNMSSVLTSIQLLLSEANPDDGLMADISHEYKFNRTKFLETARQWVLKYATEDVVERDKGKRGKKRKAEEDNNETLANKTAKCHDRTDDIECLRTVNSK